MLGHALRNIWRELLALAFMLGVLGIGLTLLSWVCVAKLGFGDALAFVFANFIGIGDPVVIATPMPTVAWVVKVICALVFLCLIIIPTTMISQEYQHVLNVERHNASLHCYKDRIIRAFDGRWDYNTKLHCRRRYLTVKNLMRILGASEADVIEAASLPHSGLRVFDRASVMPDNIYAPSDLAIEETRDDGHEWHSYPPQQSAECSNITIVAPACDREPGMRHFAHQLADFGQFNLVCRDFDQTPECRTNYYVLATTQKSQALRQYLSCLNQYASKNGHWIVCLLSAPSSRKADVHIISKMHKSFTEQYVDTINNAGAFNHWFDCLQKIMSDVLKIKCQLNREYGPHSQNNIATILKNIHPTLNVMTMRVSYAITMTGNRNIAAARLLAAHLRELT